MSVKRGVLYLAGLVLAAVLLYLGWPRSPAPTPGKPSGAERAGERRAGRSLPGGLSPSRRPGGPQVQVRGSVRDAVTNQAIAGVTVRFRAADGSAQASSGSDGVYYLQLAAGLYQVSLQAAEHAVSLPPPSVLIPDNEAVDGLDFFLRRIGSLAGRVVNRQGRPLGGAQVVVARVRGGGPLEAPKQPVRSDAQGRFSLTVPPGELVLRADAGSLGAALSRPIYLEPGAHLSGVEIRLGSGGQLGGQVISPPGGDKAKPVVLLKDELGLRELPCGPDGQFTAAGLLPGVKQVQAAAEGFAPSQVVEVKVGDGPAARVQLQLGRTQGIGGQVLSPEGAPLAGVPVSLSAGGPGGPLVQLALPREMISDASGGFLFPDVPNLPLTLTARGPGNAVTTRSGLAPGTRDIQIQLQVTGSIVGSVSDGPNSRPVRDFTLTLSSGPGIGPGNEVPPLRVVSGRGEFAIPDLVAGTYTLSVSAPGYGPAEKPGLGVVAGFAARAEIAMERAGQISGLVVDSRGVGVPGAVVKADTGWVGLPAVSDASGAFLIRDVACGRRSITATHPAFNNRILGGILVSAGQAASARVVLTGRQGSQPGLDLAGIGAVLEQEAGALQVMKALPNSPAEVAGLQAGDRVLSVDGQAWSKLGFAAAVEALRGVAGTPVRIQVQRGGQVFELHVIRGEVSVPAKG